MTACMPGWLLDEYIYIYIYIYMYFLNVYNRVHRIRIYIVLVLQRWPSGDRCKSCSDRNGVNS